MQTGRRMEVFPIRYSFHLPFLLLLQVRVDLVLLAGLRVLVCSTIAVARPEHANLGRSAA